jgi:hypothetical protein
MDERVERPWHQYFADFNRLEQENASLRREHRFALGRLGCRCTFKESNEVDLVDNHCPYHGWYGERDDFYPLTYQDLLLYKEAAESPFGQCFTLPNGDCIGHGCMHDAQYHTIAELRAENERLALLLGAAMAERDTALRQLVAAEATIERQLVLLDLIKRAVEKDQVK